RKCRPVHWASSRRETGVHPGSSPGQALSGSCFKSHGADRDSSTAASARAFRWRRKSRYTKPAPAAAPAGSPPPPPKPPPPPPPETAARHHDGFDLWRVRKLQHFVSIEIRLLGGAVLDGDFAVQRRGQRVDDRTLHLHFD